MRASKVSPEIETLARQDQHCARLMTASPPSSRAQVAAIGTGDVFCKGRDFGAWPERGENETKSFGASRSRRVA
jgi:transposase